MTVIVVGYDHSTYSPNEMELLERAFEAGGEDVVSVGTAKWLSKKRLEYRLNGDEVGLGDQTVALDDINGMYFQVSTLFRPIKFEHIYDRDFSELDQDELRILKEHRSMFHSLAHILDDNGVKTCPPPFLGDQQRLKMWQLQRYVDDDIPTPDTLFTNDIDGLSAFFNEHDQVIVKPMTRGSEVTVLTEEHLTIPRAGDLLRKMPVAAQECVEGDEYRVDVVDGDFVGASKITADRPNQSLAEVDVERVTPEKEVIEVAEEAVSSSGLTHAGVDIIAGDGRVSVLEVNPTPGFAAYGEGIGRDVAREVVRYFLE